jgi:hypothetical protein
MSGTQATGAIDRFFMLNRRMSRAVERRLPAAFTRHLHITILIYDLTTWFFHIRGLACGILVEARKPLPDRGAAARVCSASAGQAAKHGSISVFNAFAWRSIIASPKPALFLSRMPRWFFELRRGDYG